MIVKMKFVNISGPRNDIDRVTDLYLSRYEIQLESALSELKTVDNLRPFVEINPYRDVLKKAEEFVGYLPDVENVEPDTSMGLDDMFEVVRQANEDYQSLQEQKEKIKKQSEEIRARQHVIAPFRPMDCDLHKVLHYKYIVYRFGQSSAAYYQKMQKYLMDDLGAIFVEGQRDESYVYGAYFVAPAETQKVDAVFRSLHFEKIELKDEFEGTPEQAYRALDRENAKIERELADLDRQAGEMLQGKAPQLVAARDRLEELSNNFDVRKLAARMEDNKEDYYILCGWMAEDDVEKFVKEIQDDDKVFVVVEDDHDAYFGEPPTKLENPKLFKPFEMFVQMYGLPAHNELDPTLFVGITYSLIFGIMFGDVGQGLLLLIGGALIYHFKRAPLAGIIATAGVFSTIFGFVFGSIFGFENVIEPLWIRPIDHMTTLPFLGKLNTVFVVAVAFGMFLIIVAMVLHIINALRDKDIGGAWFDAQRGGRACLLRGGCGHYCIIFNRQPASGRRCHGGDVRCPAAAACILFREPLTRLIRHQSGKMEESKAMFLVEGFFEMFETLLSYFSNTISFIRIGAFAVSHAAIMEVVLQLTGAESGNPNWLGVIFGNLFVCGFEGLIVGIQVLRLEYYEMFSRFYKGSGHAFTPYTKKKTNKK